SVYCNRALFEPQHEREFQRIAVQYVDKARPMYRSRNIQIPESTLQYSEVLLKVGRVADSISEMQEIIRRHPDNVEARTNLGALLFHLKRPLEAIEHLELAARLGPGEVTVWKTLAPVREALGRKDDAITAYRNVIRLRTDQLGPGAANDDEC